jgi:hypothetical protein
MPPRHITFNIGRFLQLAFVQSIQVLHFSVASLQPMDLVTREHGKASSHDSLAFKGFAPLTEADKELVCYRQESRNAPSRSVAGNIDRDCIMMTPTIAQ